jgi:hypothetical protein
MAPIAAEQGKPRASGAFDFRRKQLKFAFEPDRTPEGHKSSTIFSIDLCFFGSIASSGRAFASAMSLALGLREGTVAANKIGSMSATGFDFCSLAFTFC